MGHNSSYRRSILMTAAAPVCWSLGGLGIRVVNVTQWEVIFWRSMFMALTVLSFLILRDQKRTFKTFRKAGIRGLGAGVFLALTSTFYVLSISHTSVANTLVLQGTSTLFAALFGWLMLHERVKIETCFAIVVAMAGVVIMVSDSLATGEFIGNLFGLGAAIAFAVNIVVVRATPEVDMIPAACIGGFLSASTAILMGNPLMIAVSDLGILAALGAVQLGLGFCLFVTGSRNLPPAQTGLLALLEMVLGPIWVWLFIGETPTKKALIGGAIVTVTLALHAILKGNARSAHPKRELRIEEKAQK